MFVQILLVNLHTIPRPIEWLQFASPSSDHPIRGDDLLSSLTAALLNLLRLTQRVAFNSTVNSLQTLRSSTTHCNPHDLTNPVALRLLESLWLDESRRHTQCTACTDATLLLNNFMEVLLSY